jgi:hypothetical protein
MRLGDDTGEGEMPFLTVDYDRSRAAILAARRK